VTRGTRPKKPSSSCGFTREARGAQGTRGTQGTRGSWGLKTENRTSFSSLFQQPATKKNKFIFYFYFRSSARTGYVRADATARPHRASEGVQREGEGREMSSSARTGLCSHGRIVASVLMRLYPCGLIIASTLTRLYPRGRAYVRTDAGARPRRQVGVYADASRFIPGNFIMDATVRPSHGRPSGHRPIVRPSAIVCVTTLLQHPLVQAPECEGPPHKENLSYAMRSPPWSLHPSSLHHLHESLDWASRKKSKWHGATLCPHTE
jgi:hypothetical protein